MRNNKFNNRKTEYNGFVFDSKKEAEHAQVLDFSRSARNEKQRVEAYRKQVPYVININGKKICTYLADFVVQYGDKRIEVQDVKGFKTDIYKLKKKLVEAVYNIKIIEY